MQIFEYAVLALYSLFIVSMSFAFGCGIAAAFPRAVKKASDINRHPNLYLCRRKPGSMFTIMAIKRAEVLRVSCAFKSARLICCSTS